MDAVRSIAAVLLAALLVSPLLAADALGQYRRDPGAHQFTLLVVRNGGQRRENHD